MHTVATFIPSPSNGVWHIGPLPLRAYALGIIIGAHGRHLDRREAVHRSRRPRGPDQRRRDLGDPVRHRRRAHLSRDHRPRAVLRRRQATSSTRSRSGTAASASGAPIAGGAVGATHRVPSLRRLVLVGRGRAGAGSPRRAGDRSHRQLLQPGAVRQAHHQAVGPRDRRGQPPRRLSPSSRRSTRRSCTSCSGTSAPRRC